MKGEQSNKSAYAEAKNDSQRVISKTNEVERSRWSNELETQTELIE